MTELFRSEDMKYVSLTMTNDSAHSTVFEVGKFALFHVEDLSSMDGVPSKQHNAYKRRVQDCEFWEKKLNNLEHELKTYGVPINHDADLAPLHSADMVETVRALVEPLENDLNQSLNFLKENKRLIAASIERRHTLTLCQDLDLAAQARQMARVAQLERKENIAGGAGAAAPIELQALEAEAKDPMDKFRNFVCGVIAIDQQPMFRRMLYRVSRGNAFARFANIPGLIEDPNSGELQSKSVFYVVVLGQQLFQRINKMCELFRASVYELPADQKEYIDTLQHIKDDIRDKQEINIRTEDSIVALLTKLGNDNGTCTLRNYQTALAQEKAICGVMMKAHYYLTMISIEGWVPTSAIPDLKLAVKNAVAGTGHPPAAVEVEPANPIRMPTTPPTYFKTDRYTETFQGIVETYGIPRYKEVNPGLFTIITFPFLFGVMYGDIGHGVLLSSAAFAMIYFERQLLAKQKIGELGEIASMAFGGRYIMFLMGLFAVYCGIIYNDCLSIPLNMYGSSWQWNGNQFVSDGTTYPCGIDPKWSHKTNELAFYNSLKMKMAVILGVCQMLFGISLSAFNHLYFKDMNSLYFECIPKFVFLLSTFGYMIWMVLYKWCQDWTGRNAPNLIQTMIAMFLAPGSIEPDKQLYSGQAGFQVFLLLCAFISVPVMLLVKPLLQKQAHEKSGLHGLIRHQQREEESKSALSEDEEKLNLVPDSVSVQVNENVSGGHGHGEYNFSDEMIHSGIHTIEFVLGCVSNTASYLRLWALSLAHAELAKVFWEKMIMQYGALTGSGVMAFIGFGVWFGATFAVLLCMDVLECFLHALRLHWVEFQSKFFYADGIAFQPFNFHQEQSEKH